MNDNGRVLPLADCYNVPVRTVVRNRDGTALLTLNGVHLDEPGAEAIVAIVAGLTAERDRLARALVDDARVAVCPECGMRANRCDEDRCCTTCGNDLIICADAHSAAVLCERAPKDPDTAGEPVSNAYQFDVAARAELARVREALDAANVEVGAPQDVRVARLAADRDEAVRRLRRVYAIVKPQ